MEAAIVAAGRHTSNISQGVKILRGKNQQTAVCTSFETLPFGLPIGANRLFLQMDERVAFRKTFVLHQQLSTRNARGDENCLSAENVSQPSFTLSNIIAGCFIGKVTDRMTTMALHLLFASPSQQKQVAEGTITAPFDLDMKATPHRIGQKAAQERPSGVVIHIGNHRFEMSSIKAHSVIVIVIEKRTLLTIDKGIVLLPLLVGKAAY